MESLRRLISMYLVAHGVLPDRVEQAYPTGPETGWEMDYRHEAWGSSRIWPSRKRVLMQRQR